MTQYSGVWSTTQALQAGKAGNWTGVAPSVVEYLVVAGGGAGGWSIGGGGGAGGLLQGLTGVTQGSSITVTVGAGGTGVGSGTTQPSGNNSVFGNITANGGGGGGIYNTAQNGISGGSGGGAGGGTYGSYFGGSGISGQGNAGGLGRDGSTVWNGGGGGGAGTVGMSAPSNSSSIPLNGGAGIASSINGTVTTYAGGGGGANYAGGTNGTGGVGGGGTGGGNPGGNGTVNTGGGGGGGTYNASSGGSGGSGIVILSYSDIYNPPANTTGSPTVSTSGSGSIYFNGSSAVNPPANSVLSLTTGNWTVEGWIYTSTPAASAATNTIFCNGFPVQIYAQSNTVAMYVSSTNSSGSYFINPASGPASSVSSNTWCHFACVKNGNNYTVYVNGVAGTTVTNSTAPAGVGGTSSPSIGSYNAGASAFFSGYITNLRINNTALYTANFAPPITPLTPITNTVFLFSSVSGSQFADSSGSALASTVTSAPAWNQLSPFPTGGGYKKRVYTWTSSGSITF